MEVAETMKEWEILSDEETDWIWYEVEKNFKFNPRYNTSMNSTQFLKLPKPLHVYDMHLFTAYLKDKSVTITEEYYNIFNKFIIDILIQCMGEEEFLYALDWQHTCFKYNPKSEERMPRVLETERYNVYFPDFYADGDYYFFIAKDFSWGYFTNPWTQQLWVFGDKMLKGVSKVPSVYLTLRR